MDGDKTVTATFTQIEYTLTVTIDPLGAGTATLDKAVPYHYGDTVTLTPTPNTDYTSNTWGGDGTNGPANTRIITITGNMAVTATFTPSTLPTQASFDIGTSISPVETSYFKVTESTLYSYGLGYGWASPTKLYSVDRSVPDALRGDFVYSGAENTFNVDLANGVYQITVI